MFLKLEHVIVRLYAFEMADIAFIDENGGGPGMCLWKRQGPKKPK